MKKTFEEEFGEKSDQDFLKYFTRIVYMHSSLLSRDLPQFFPKLKGKVREIEERLFKNQREEQKLQPDPN